MQVSPHYANKMRACGSITIPTANSPRKRNTRIHMHATNTTAIAHRYPVIILGYKGTSTDLRTFVDAIESYSKIP